jgi:hypothetical protein
MKRLVQPELLDTLPPDDPRAIGSRQDLRRINWWMGNHRIMARALEKNRPGKSFGGVVEIGAGDGDFFRRVAKKLPRPQVVAKVTLLDRQACVSEQTKAGLARMGWLAETVVADVFDGLARSEPAAAILTNLFLHHFKDDRLAELLLKISRETRLLVAVEPHRFSHPGACGQLLRVIGCNAVTLHDAAVSVRAGFVGRELSDLWPDQKSWQLTEHRAGWFSHLFVAKRIL